MQYLVVTYFLLFKKKSMTIKAPSVENRLGNPDNRVLFEKIIDIQELLQTDPYKLDQDALNELESKLIKAIFERDPLLGLANYISKKPEVETIYSLNIIEPNIRDLNKKLGISGADEVMAKVKKIIAEKLNAQIWNQSANGFRFCLSDNTETALRTNLEELKETTINHNGQSYVIKVAIGSNDLPNAETEKDETKLDLNQLAFLANQLYKLDIATNIAKKRQRNSSYNEATQKRLVQKYEANYAILDSIQSFAQLLEYTAKQRDKKITNNHGIEISHTTIFNTFLFENTICQISPEVIKLIRKGQNFSELANIEEIAKINDINNVKEIKNIVDNPEFRQVVINTIASITYFDHIKPTTIDNEKNSDEENYYQNCLAIIERINEPSNEKKSQTEKVETLQYILRQSPKSTPSVTQLDKNSFFEELVMSAPGQTLFLAMLDVVGLGQRNITNLQTTLQSTFGEIAKKLNKLTDLENQPATIKRLKAILDSYNEKTANKTNQEIGIVSLIIAINQVLKDEPDGEQTREKILAFIKSIDSYPSFESNILRGLDAETNKIQAIISKITNTIQELTGVRATINISTGGDEIYLVCELDSIYEENSDLKKLKEIFNNKIRSVLADEPVRGSTVIYRNKAEQDQYDRARQIIRMLTALEAIIEKLKKDGAAFPKD